MSTDDFFSGLFAALVTRGITAISIRGQGFYQAIEATYQRLVEGHASSGAEPRFAVVLDPLHGDSPLVREAISSIVLRDMASLDNPEYQDLRFKIGRTEAVDIMSRRPGGQALYEDLADTFLLHHSHVAI